MESASYGLLRLPRLALIHDTLQLSAAGSYLLGADFLTLLVPATSFHYKHCLPGPADSQLGETPVPDFSPGKFPSMEKMQRDGSVRVPMYCAGPRPEDFYGMMLASLIPPK
jgi:hypothetical protein